MYRPLLLLIEIIALAGSVHANEPSVVSVTRVLSGPGAAVLQDGNHVQRKPARIDIYPDGNVFVRTYDGIERTKHMDRKAVRSLVHSLMETRFYLVTEKSLKHAISKQFPGYLPSVDLISDCSTWTIRAREGRVAYTTRFYAPFEWAGQFPDNEGLKHLTSAILKVYSAVGEETR